MCKELYKILLSIWMLAIWSHTAFADTRGRVSKPQNPVTEVSLGSILALSGPSYQLGTQMLDGMRAFFSDKTDLKIRITPFDDGYQGECTKAIHSAIVNVYQSVSQCRYSYPAKLDGFKPIAFIGNVGTPTTNSILPSLVYPVVGPFTGSSLFRDGSPASRKVFNVRASYFAELEKIDEDLRRRGIAPRDVVLLTGASSFGSSVVKDALCIWRSPSASTHLACERRQRAKILDLSEESNCTQSKIGVPKGAPESGPRRVCHGGNANDEDDPVGKLITDSVAPSAIIVVGSYKNSADLIESLNKSLSNTVFYVLSFAGYQVLYKELIERDVESDLVYMTRVVPPIEESEDESFWFSGNCNKEPSAIVDYKRVMMNWYDDERTEDSGLSDISFEGYLVASLMYEVLTQLREPYSAESVEDVLNKAQDLNIGLCQPIRFDIPAQQEENVWLTHLKLKKNKA